MRGRTILLALVATGVVAALAPATEASAAAAPASGPVPAPVNPRAIQAVRNCPVPTVARVMECMSMRLTGLPIRRAAVPDVPSQPPPGYGPADLDSAYNLSGSGGSGQTIAIVDAYNDPNAESDLAGYRFTFGLPACTVASGCLRIVNQSGLPSALPANNAAWAGEESLDLDMVSAICPLCDIILVEAGSNTWANLYAAEDRAVTMGAKFISNSWGGIEYSGETSDDVHFKNETWSALSAISPDATSLLSVSCTSPTLCVAVSSAGEFTVYNGTGWSALTPPPCPARPRLETEQTWPRTLGWHSCPGNRQNKRPKDLNPASHRASPRPYNVWPARTFLAITPHQAHDLGELSRPGVGAAGTRADVRAVGAAARRSQ